MEFSAWTFVRPSIELVCGCGTREHLWGIFGMEFLEYFIGNFWNNLPLETEFGIVGIDPQQIGRIKSWVKYKINFYPFAQQNHSKFSLGISGIKF